jgi:hypothetical protein
MDLSKRPIDPGYLPTHWPGLTSLTMGNVTAGGCAKYVLLQRALSAALTDVLGAE